MDGQTYYRTFGSITRENGLITISVESGFKVRESDLRQWLDSEDKNGEFIGLNIPATA